MKLKQARKLLCYLLPCLLFIAGMIFIGCDSGTVGCDPDSEIPTDPIIPEPVTDGGSRRAVVADWLNKSISNINLDALQRGATYNDIDVCNAETFGALGLTYDAFSGRAIMTMTRARLLAVIDLETRESFTIALPGANAGPADIALIS